MIRIVINGAAGRMGQTIAGLVLKDSSLKLTGVVDAPENAGKDVCGIKVVSELEDIVGQADVVVDFSHISSTAHLLEVAQGSGKAVVIGTTGHTDEHKKLFEAASKTIPLLVSPNMSEGVNLLWKLSEVAAKTLGKNSGIEIVEAHHVHKKDAPSGTAKKLMEIVKPYSGGDISVQSIREGEIVGDHRITFKTAGDKIELFHSAFTREIFARGAVRAAKWMAGKPVGLYDMFDVLFEGMDR